MAITAKRQPSLTDVRRTPVAGGDGARRSRKAVPAPAGAVARPSRWKASLPPAIIVAVVWASFLPALRCGFINFDDPILITNNPHIRKGLTLQSIRYATTTLDVGYPEPLVLLSFLVDVSLFGLGRPGGFHAVNLAIHAVNAILVYRLLSRLIGRPGGLLPAAFAAALWAIHPLRVESVAWVTERKDVLAMLFGLLTVLAYLRFAGGRSLRSYLWMLAALCLSLSCKPLFLPLPALLLLLDYWPLRRALNRQLLLEKIPVLIAVVGATILGMIGQSRLPIDPDRVGRAGRLANAAVSYARYLGKTAWPDRLAVYYPFPERWAAWQVAGSILLIVSLTIITVRQARRRPWLIVGWLWFVLSLLPASGIVRVGDYALADRYTYLPSIGLALILAVGAGWTWEAIAARYPRQRAARLVVSMAAAAILAVSGWASFIQTMYWKDSITLFAHTVDVTRENPSAQDSLGCAYLAAGEPARAVEHFREALRNWPDVAELHVNLGSAFGDMGDLQSASVEYRRALQLDPNDKRACYNLGTDSMNAGRLPDAIESLRMAVRIDPDYADAHFNLGITLLRSGQMNAAIRQFQECQRIDPGDVESQRILNKAMADSRN